MTTILSWNIQAGRGVDGRVDLERIARTVRALADADVICMQEVESRGSGGPGGDAASVREDQFETLRDLFPGYTAVIGASIERAETDAASMYRFGNRRVIPYLDDGRGVDCAIAAEPSALANAGISLRLRGERRFIDFVEVFLA